MKLVNRGNVRKSFRDYVEGYDINDVKVRLKVDHTYRVAELSERIGASIGLSEEDLDLCYLCGMLHDIGRFEQLRRYHTFRDQISCNHAALSADLLFREGLIRAYVPESEEDSLLEKTIRLHNVYLLPESLTERERTFCNILRDADKIDIFRVNVETPVEEIYDIPLQDFRTASITDAVFQGIKEHRNINRAHSRTPMDYLVAHMAFVFGLVYPISLEITLKQGWLEKSMHFESENPDTVKKLSEIREEVHAYINMRISGAYTCK